MALLTMTSGCSGSHAPRPHPDRAHTPTGHTAGGSGLQLPLRVAGASLGIDSERHYGRGVSVVDLDNDGWDDVFFTDTDSRFRGREYGISRAVRNDHGHFVPWDLGISRRDVFENGGAAFGDIDGDGAPDLLIVNGNNTGRSRLALYMNRLTTAHRFVRATREAGITDAPGAWWGASFADIDVDGRLDLVVTGSRLLLYHNEGDGHFQEQSEIRGLATPFSGDVRGDLQNPVWLAGDPRATAPDLLLAGLTAIHLYRNDGHGVFRDVTDSALPPEVRALQPRVFSSAAADFDQDGRDDIYLGRWWYQDVLLLNEGDGRFSFHTTDVGIVERHAPEPDGPTDNVGILPIEQRTPRWGSENTMGLGTGDVDGNGVPDVLIGTGDPTRANPPIAFCTFPDPMRRVRFRRCSSVFVSGNGRRSRGHGIAVGDLDHDGSIDVVSNPGGFPPWDAQFGKDTRERAVVYLGVAKAAPPSAVLRLVTDENGAAIGARVRVASNPVHFDTVRSVQGFQSQNSAALILPLGDGPATVEITWPDGRRTGKTIAPGDRLTIVQPRG